MFTLDFITQRSHCQYLCRKLHKRAFGPASDFAGPVKGNPPGRLRPLAPEHLLPADDGQGWLQCLVQQYDVRVVAEGQAALAQPQHVGGDAVGMSGKSPTSAARTSRRWPFRASSKIGTALPDESLGTEHPVEVCPEPWPSLPDQRSSHREAGSMSWPETRSRRRSAGRESPERDRFPSRRGPLARGCAGQSAQAQRTCHPLQCARLLAVPALHQPIPRP